MSAPSTEPPAGRSTSSSNGSNNSDKRALDPVFRNALRYTVSAKEYEVLHKYLVSRAPAQVQKRAPRPKKYEAMINNDSSGSEYNIASVRAALRVFVAVYAGFKGWEAISQRLLKRSQQTKAAAAPPAPRHANARIAASFSFILLFHRLLHRFLTRLRSSLLDSSADPFRSRNPRVARALTSSYTPALGASLAGLFLGLTPSSPLRSTIAIYVLVRSMEFTYNALEEARIIFSEGRPSWFGSWLLMPFCYGQLLHAFVFDRDCFPSGFGDFILRRSPEYIHTRPANYPAAKPYPATYDVVDGLASLAKLKWPPFTSPILFPNSLSKPAPTAALQAVRPLTSPAHPLIKHTSCAVLHPSDPSCARTYLKFWLRSFPSTLRLMTAIYSAFALLRFRALLASPSAVTRRLAERVLRLTIFITGAIGTAWGSICLFAAFLPRSFLPSQRFFLSGMLGGSWAYVARKGERGNFLYCLRLSIDSAWKVGKKHGWWKGIKGGDVLLFTAALAVTGLVFEQRPKAVSTGVVRKGLSWSRGEGWKDRVGKEEKTEEKLE
ncbi:hypothetical protein K461DRAFT_248599 [Myriangium duriaei CBS 260.36]|uniref:Transmembrane protein 135 N-terminal domain-containing protein n=1 Tax=Myriangium duriaei CBS 260.36 TaxID=1168546 RepID=A0A9P4MC20_9PEZI|nr:hypothetical protein K461DRAFT_248599 [Myriangium duriaei CBS 260.36]